ncbi:hypothetical protein CPT03_08380 [Pedobacter ginsengisoli]|uniref:Uncharacterized protein n=1 Tax=Pedobacter ginsengisoli TaxID=363852 RepID=A0A2D1U4F3_9SPHI|nr:hypothetical protein [Pedobacter ginsengisoli]ATP56487.1 hypothetical protein CPT03_08380 [Pedobacter ginsengisoli]
MVYLEQQSGYLSQFADSQIAPLLNEILKQEVGEFSDDIHNAGDLALNLLICLKSNDDQNALKYYTIFNKRQPTKDSHWIYDNYVLFAIVCTVRKFNFDTQWIRNVISISYNGADSINKRIKDTFRNILAENYNAKGDFHQVSLVYQYLANDGHYQNEAINKMFHHLWLKSFPFFEEDFLNVLSIKAIEIAFSKKALLTDREFYYLNGFVPSFNARADLFAKIFSRLIIIGLIALVFYVIWKLNNSEKDYPLTVKMIVFLSSFSGVGVFAIWGWKGNFASFFRTFINKLFNYNEQR